MMELYINLISFTGLSFSVSENYEDLIDSLRQASDELQLLEVSKHLYIILCEFLHFLSKKISKTLPKYGATVYGCPFPISFFEFIIV